MTATDQLSRLAPYVGRLLEDEYIQAQIGEALTGLRRSSRRAKRQSASEALTDRRLRNQLRDAASSLAAAARALQEPPRPQRHPLRQTLLLIGAGVAGALLWRARFATGGVSRGHTAAP